MSRSKKGKSSGLRRRGRSVDRSSENEAQRPTADVDSEIEGQLTDCEVDRVTPMDETLAKTMDEMEKKLKVSGPSVAASDDSPNDDRASYFTSLLFIPIAMGVRLLLTILSVVLFVPLAIIRGVFGVNLDVSMKQFFQATPLFIRLERRKQSSAVLLFVLMLPLAAVSHLASIWLVFFPLTAPFMIAYLTFIWVIDTAPEDGSRKPVARFFSWQRHYANYFPLSLERMSGWESEKSEKAEDGETPKKYVFGYHPHGIISMGVIGAFASDACGFSRKFPGVDLRVMTLAQNFKVPFIRECLLWMGICSASKKSCNQILSADKSILLVVGGAAESLDTKPGTFRLTLARQGFVRVALDNHASLVPVLAFGENDIYDTVEVPRGSKMRRAMDWFQKTVGWVSPVFHGRGVFNYSFGMMPHRKPIHIVVGDPIPVEKIPDRLKGDKLYKTQEGKDLVNKYHQQYIDGLQKIFDNHKHKYALKRSESLKIIS